MNLKKIRLPAILFLSTILLASCDHWQFAEGRVFDSETKRPIDSVYVQPVDKPNGVYSDSLGKFALMGKPISPLSAGPPMVMRFKKRGYDSLVLKGDGTDSQIVYLKKSKLQIAH